MIDRWTPGRGGAIAPTGRARNGISHLRVAISPDGTCGLTVEGGGLDHLHLRCLAYFLG